MLTVNVSGDISRALRRLGALGEQAPYAAALAVNHTGRQVTQAVIAEMGRVFDRPTRYALKSFVLKKRATKTDLVAVCGLRDVLSSKSRLSPAELLGHHFTGGPRARTGLERYLSSWSLIGTGEYVVPGAGARLDQYGNMSRGQIQQIISQLRIGIDPAQNTSKSRRSQRNVRQAGRIFWSRGNTLPRGAWIDQGRGVGVRPLLVVTSKPSYGKRIDLGRIGAEVCRREFNPAFTEAMRKAMASAR